MMDEGDGDGGRGHEGVGANALAGLFGDAVLEPIALHVAAKRYLCLREPGYAEALSEASQRSLEWQGGAYTAGQATAFETRPGWREAVELRRWDDLGKSHERCGRQWSDYMPLLRTLLTGA
jgi:predicted HD phosphohydrolase